jgi:hypothetical protein
MTELESLVNSGEPTVYHLKSDKSSSSSSSSSCDKDILDFATNPYDPEDSYSEYKQTPPNKSVY